MNFHAETRLGAYAAAEACVHLYLRDGRRYQVQLPPRGAAFRQLQLMRGRLQLPDGDFLFELSYERGGLLCPSQRASLTTWTSPVGTACLRGIGRRLSQKMRSMLRTGAWPSNAPASHEILLKSLMTPRAFLSDHAVIACAVVDRTCVAVAFFYDV